jgi:cytidyltransferase-like protein
MTIGTFDLFHEGHVNLLHRCQSFGDVTIGVNSDRFVVGYKGVLPTCPESSRLASVGAYGAAFLHDGNTAEFIEAHDPDLLVVGSDWARRDYLDQLGVDQSWLDTHDVSVLYVPYTQGISSTMLRASRG